MITIIVVAISAITTLSFVWADTGDNKPVPMSPFLNRVAELVEVDPFELREAFVQAKRELKSSAPFANGRPTREETVLKSDYLKKKHHAHPKGKPDWEQLNRKIRAAIESGELTPEEAALKLDGLKKKHQAHPKGKPDWEQLNRKIRAAVESGQLTPEEATLKLDELKKKPSQWKLEDVKSRMQAAIKSGKVTQQQADERLKAWKDHEAAMPKSRRPAK
jgi:hypothetical protein